MALKRSILGKSQGNLIDESDKIKHLQQVIFQIVYMFLKMLIEEKQQRNASSLAMLLSVGGPCNQDLEKLHSRPIYNNESNDYSK